MVVTFHRLVGNTYGLTLQHSMCQFLLTGKMEIGEHHLSLSHQRIFRLDGFLHLHYHVALAIDILDCGQDTGSGLHIFVIRETAAFASRVLNAHLMATTCQCGNASGSHSHPILIVLNLLWNTDFHNISFLGYTFFFGLKVRKRISSRPKEFRFFCDKRSHLFCPK